MPLNSRGIALSDYLPSCFIWYRFYGIFWWKRTRRFDCSYTPLRLLLLTSNLTIVLEIRFLLSTTNTCKVWMLRLNLPRSLWGAWLWKSTTLDTHINFTCICVGIFITFRCTLTFCLEKWWFSIGFSHSRHICKNYPRVRRLLYPWLASVCETLPALHIALLSTILRIYSEKFPSLNKNRCATSILRFRYLILPGLLARLRFIWSLRSLWFLRLHLI